MDLMDPDHAYALGRLERRAERRELGDPLRFEVGVGRVNWAVSDHNTFGGSEGHCDEYGFELNDA